MRSPRLGTRHLGQGGANRLLEPYEPLHLDGSGVPLAVLLRLARSQPKRAERLVRGIADPAARETARGWLALRRGARLEAGRRFDAALALGPDPMARVGRVTVDALRGRPIEEAALESLPEAQAAVIRGVVLDQSDPTAVAGLDPLLARVGPSDPLFPNAARMRVRWRLAAGGVEHAAEAIELLDVAFAGTWSGPELLARARAGVAAGETEVALATLEDIATQVGNLSGGRRGLAALRKDALRVLESIPEGTLDAALRERVRAELSGVPTARR